MDSKMKSMNQSFKADSILTDLRRIEDSSHGKIFLNNRKLVCGLIFGYLV